MASSVRCVMRTAEVLEDGESWHVSVTSETRTRYATLRNPFLADQEQALRWYLEEYPLNDPFQSDRAAAVSLSLVQYVAELVEQLELKNILTGEVNFLELLIYGHDDDFSIHALHWEAIETLAPIIGFPISVGRVFTPKGAAQDEVARPQEEKLKVLVVIARCTDPSAYEVEPNILLESIVNIFLQEQQGAKCTRENYELRSKKVVAYEVQQHPALFDELQQHHGPTVKTLLSKPSAQKGVFMLIGCKTASNATIWHGNAATSAVRAAGQFIAPDPVSGGAATQAVPVAEGEVSARQSWSSVVVGTTAGERVFAAEYCEIRWRKTGLELGAPGAVKFKKVVRNVGIKSYGSMALAFRGESDEEEEEEGEEGEREHDDLM